MASKRALAGKLSVVAGFENPQLGLEQYPTPPDLAAHVIHLADLQGDIAGQTVIELGAGTGMLTLGAALRGPARVIGVEVDRSAIETARKNRNRVGTTTAIHWVQADGGRVPLQLSEPTTVVMNPPFGAQNGSHGADKRFLKSAAELSDVSYSIHNAGSQAFIESFARDHGGTVTHAFEAAFEAPKQFAHQTNDRKELSTEVYRIEWSS